MLLLLPVVLQEFLYWIIFFISKKMERRRCNWQRELSFLLWVLHFLCTRSGPKKTIHFLRHMQKACLNLQDGGRWHQNFLPPIYTFPRSRKISGTPIFIIRTRVLLLVALAVGLNKTRHSYGRGFLCQS